MKMRNLVILFSLCVIKCMAMTRSELEDFSNFLEMTSQLDLNVKSKGPDDEYDEEELISDHAWEESGKFEGDLILNERQRRLLVADIAEGLSRNGLQDSTKRWPNNEVTYYIQREHFSSGQVQAILAGIEDLAQVSCVKFTPYRKGDRDAVVIQGSRRGCFSQVGYQGGYQVLNLSGRHPVGRGCFRHGTVVHELLHALGFYHMQSSPDRDDYIDVLWQNIVQPARHNFRKYNSFAVNDFGVGYDYDSVLHYSRKAFSSNGQDTLVPKQRGAEIGQRVGLSQKDIQKLNRMYCDVDSNDSNNSDDGTAPKKPVIMKKKSKNRAFEGHGIGYHKGKTVVIKLKPTVELYRLPTLQKFHIFDYFSKAPQVLPSTLIERNRNREEMIHASRPLANTEEYFAPTTSKSPQQKLEENYMIKMINTAIPSSEERPSEILLSMHQRKMNNFSDELNEDAGEAHDLTDFDKDYSKYHNPGIKREKESEIVKVDNLFNSAELLINDSVYNSEENSNVEKVPEQLQGYIKNPFGHHRDEDSQKFNSFIPQKHESVKEDKSRNNYSLRKYHYDPNEWLIPEHKSFLKYESNNNNNTNGRYILHNNNIPLHENWYTLDQDEKKGNRNAKRLPIGRHYANSDIKEPYVMFGAPVPLTLNGYKKDNSEHQNVHPSYFVHGEPS